LVTAFRATLEEVAEADIILHVRDAAHPDTQAQRADVIAVLEGMAKDGTLSADWQRRSIEVLNKADLLGGVAHLGARPGEIAVSALTGEGLPALTTAVDTRLSEGMVTAGYDIPASDGAQLAWLYGHGEVIGRQDTGEVIGRQDTDEVIHVTVRLSPDDRARFERQMVQPEQAARPTGPER
jgi:GTP-binding protein HflX